MISTLYTDTSIILVIDGRSEVIARDAPQAEAILEELQKAKPDEAILLKLARTNTAIKQYSDNDLEVLEDGSVYRNGVKLSEVLAQRIRDCFRDNVPYKHLLAFFDRLSANVSLRAIEELYNFLEHQHMPITPTGTFLGYKGVGSDWMDLFSHRFLNKPGCIHTMPRNEVDDDFRHGCSVGFHVGSLAYATQWAGSNGHVVIVEVDPADVVSIPSDCYFQKLRTFQYKVVCESQGTMTDSAVEDPTKPYGTAYKARDPFENEGPEVSVVIITHRTGEPDHVDPGIAIAKDDGAKRATYLMDAGISVDVTRYFNARRMRYLKEKYGSNTNRVNAYIEAFSAEMED